MFSTGWAPLSTSGRGAERTLPSTPREEPWADVVYPTGFVGVESGKFFLYLAGCESGRGSG